MRKELFGLSLLVVSASPALGQDKAAIQKLNDSFAAALNKGDAATVAGMYAEDAFILPSGSPLVTGRSSIQSFWGKAVQDVGDMKLTTVDVKALGGDAAREIGTYTLKTKGPQAQEIAGKYVVIWQKVGSDWKLATDIWNADK